MGGEIRELPNWVSFGEVSGVVKGDEDVQSSIVSIQRDFEDFLRCQGIDLDNDLFTPSYNSSTLVHDFDNPAFLSYSPQYTTFQGGGTSSHLPLWGLEPSTNGLSPLTKGHEESGGGTGVVVKSSFPLCFSTMSTTKVAKKVIPPFPIEQCCCSSFKRRRADEQTSSSSILLEEEDECDEDEDRDLITIKTREEEDTQDKSPNIPLVTQEPQQQSSLSHPCTPEGWASWRLPIGEKGRAELKHDIADMMKQHSGLKEQVQKIVGCKLKTASIPQLFHMAHLCGLWDKAIRISKDHFYSRLSKTLKKSSCKISNSSNASSLTNKNSNTTEKIVSSQPMPVFSLHAGMETLLREHATLLGFELNEAILYVTGSQHKRSCSGHSDEDLLTKTTNSASSTLARRTTSKMRECRLHKKTKPSRGRTSKQRTNRNTVRIVAPMRCHPTQEGRREILTNVLGDGADDDEEQEEKLYVDY